MENKLNNYINRKLRVFLMKTLGSNLSLLQTVYKVYGKAFVYFIYRQYLVAMLIETSRKHE